MTTSLSSFVNGGKDSGIQGTGRRAAYAMLSCNTSTVWNGFALYDDNFQMPFNNGYPGSYSNYSASHVVDFAGTTHMYGPSMMFDGNRTGSQSVPSTAGTLWYINATNNHGEFGNASLDVYSDGSFGRCSRMSGNASNKQYLNAYAINSDVSDKRNVYIVYNGLLRCVDRLYGSYNSDKPGTLAYSVPGLIASMQGSASYNKARKELTFLSMVSPSGAYQIITYANVDLDAYPSPTAALTAAGVTITLASLSIPSWNVNNAESYYNIKPIVSADGSIFISVMFTSSDFALFKVTRNGTTAVSATRQTTMSITTSYGLDQGFYYGQRQITSKDGTSVATFCPYYYYGAGIMCYMIDKTNNTFTTYTNTDTSSGYHCVPYKDSGWAIWFCGNAYASNYSGGYFASVYSRSTSNLLASIGATVYATHFTGPSTTNYPGMTQVTDYVLLPSTSYGVK